MRIEYTAKRNLASGHSLDQQYVIGVDAPATAPPLRSVREIKTGGRSIGGLERTAARRLETVWRVRTTSVAPGVSLDELEEFLASTAFGEIFTFDRNGDASTEVSPVTVVREGRQHSRIFRIPVAGGDADGQRYALEFVCRETVPIVP